ncbi:NUDIX domain-containing protein [Streptomyces sp. NPDC002773]|uniref:NUDIX domain-containing protein n=1 Tax=Streptomyces sp. NPDC002773 TaxID=3154430 RepID=UPI003318AB58
MPESGSSRRPSARLHATETLSEGWYTLRRYSLDVTRTDGTTQRLSRADLRRGDRAAVLLYSPVVGTVVLTRQFRLPVFLQGDPHGQLIEAPGGLLDEAGAEEAVRREAEEETGFRVAELRKAFTTYLSPQLSSERTHLFTGVYDPGVRSGPGGGVPGEGEDIEVLELPLREALEQVQREEAADAKTLLLLLHAQNLGLCTP